ncbi:MAG TPA: hypothetical protein VGA99_06810, partial [bacterium]
MKARKVTLGVLSVGICLLMGSALLAQSPLWGDLQPGPHAVGFKVEHKYDYSRSFGLKYDFEGKLNADAVKRPIQISIWYPAQKGGSAMTFRDYVNLVATEVNFRELTDEAKTQARDAFFQGARQQGVTDEELDELMDMSMIAVKDASAQQGSFPLIVYAA